MDNNKQEDETIQVETNYEVERILDSKEELDGQLYYYIKWKEYSNRDNT